MLIGRTDSTSYNLGGLNPDSEFTIYVIAVDASGNRSEKSNSITARTPILPAISAIKTSTSPVIDGLLMKYGKQPQVYPLTKGLNNNKITNEADFSVNFRALWDEDSLYLMAEIKIRIFIPSPLSLGIRWY
jgi:hypothetical protein